ncbi:MAG TPA: polyketide synthase, partial [Saliniramus sp.]|nr:polyketide synthase [Saliniramus sp.]
MYEEQLRRAIQTIRQLRTELDEAREALGAPIAIVGMGCRLPGGADSPEAFARLLDAGYDAVRETPGERWSNETWYDPDPDAPGKLNTRWGAFLDGLEDFDPAFFDLSEREVAEMDPQQRLLLETSWEALERAAIAPASLSGTRAGVFVGINGAEYYQRGIEDPGTITAHTLSGGVASAAAGRIAYQLGLNGPAVAIDTACSSSLAAVHQACRSLRSGESDRALAGGVYVVLEPNLSV